MHTGISIVICRFWCIFLKYISTPKPATYLYRKKKAIYPCNYWWWLYN